MKKLVTFFSLFFILLVHAQEETVHSIYFDTDVSELKPLQSEAVVAFLKLIDTTRLESISIYGYCDDIGKVDYNYKLSQKRANGVKDMLIKKGIKLKIIVTIEGKGKVMIDEDLEENVPEARSKNRRVDVVLNFKPLVIEELNIPGIYKTIRKDAVEGDRIYLEHVLFEKGSSSLTFASKKELDKIVLLLKRYPKICIEIQGHVCCTPTFQREAIDKQTKKRELSTNRAKRVYRYFQEKGISITRMTYKGFGNTQPLGKDVQYDRRVELIITKTK
ncbi:OmpA family protein [Flavobacterium sp.]|jgi:outer membrane protein OmpA-like peptidoglycan-associated protein|uniref:OmpA family protein n=1 Tax=Flavobacterium sp. TaxID=239 RepID=UPI0025C5223F|nr:OmpA family protein [Flavobacterium sp.]